MEAMAACKIFLWPIINGQEWAITYDIEMVDSWGDSDIEPAGEVWELLSGTETLDDSNGAVQLWVPDGYIEKICQKHFDLEH